MNPDSFFSKSFEVRNGVYFLSEEKPFDQSYLSVREKEGRVYSDDAVMRLPVVDRAHSQYAEWQMRQQSSHRFTEWIKDRKPKSILEIGCGNGWFSNQINQTGAHQVVGLDINRPELEQAAKLFGEQDITFVYGDVFEGIFNPDVFDVIVFNASIQYFENFEQLVSVLKPWLRPDGEIHVLDTQFYDASETKAAAERTRKYYQSMGHPEMAAHYFHRTWDEIQPYDFNVLYRPASGLRKASQKLRGVTSSPFPWISLQS